MAPPVWPGQPLLIGIFALHNLEEILFIGRDAALNQRLLDAVGIDEGSCRRDRMALATGLLTALSHALSRRLENPATSHQALLGTAVAGALGGNALSHLGRAIAQRRYNGGLATSLVLLPAALQVLRRLAARGVLTRRQVAAATVAGNVLAVPAIVIALTAARKVLR